LPGLAGRLYLFGPNIDYPLAGDGRLTVDLFNDEPEAGKEPKLLEQWRIDKDTLKRLLKKDTIGWGYTLFLPWGTYKPEITHVHLRLRYDPAHGTPIFHQTEGFMLISESTGSRERTSMKQAPATAERKLATPPSG